MRIAIFPNFQKKNALPCAKDVCQILHRLGAELYMDESCAVEFANFGYIRYDIFSVLAHHVDIVIAIGGDGTILRCAKQMIGSKALLLGINTGHLGFMSSMERTQLDRLDRLFTGEYHTSERMLLRGTLRGDEKQTSFIALNDISVAGMYGKIFDFTIHADHMLVGNYRADGLVCSTPTGATAYAMSAGGPIMEPELSCLEIVLICPHTMFHRPLLFSSDRTLTVRHSASCERNIYLSADGEPPLAFPPNCQLELKKSKHTLSMLSFTEDSFLDAVNHKLMQPIKGFSD